MALLTHCNKTIKLTIYLPNWQFWRQLSPEFYPWSECTTWASSWQNKQNGLYAQRRLRSAWWMPRLIWVFAGRTGQFGGFDTSRLKCICLVGIMIMFCKRIACMSYLCYLMTKNGFGGNFMILFHNFVSPLTLFFYIMWNNILLRFCYGSHPCWLHKEVFWKDVSH